MPLTALALLLMPAGAMAKTPAAWSRLVAPLGARSGSHATDGVTRVSTASDESTSLSTSLSGGGLSGASITVPAGTAVTDQATLSGVNAGSATGTVTYTAYSDSSCTTEVAGGSAEDITTPGTLPASDLATLTAGTYYWQATYSGDADNDGSSSTCGSEVETVQSSQGNGADLAVAESLLTDVSFGYYSMSVTVTNDGPSTATHVLTALLIPTNAYFLNKKDVVVHGRLRIYGDASLAPGASVTFPVNIFMPGNPETFTAATLSLTTKDPNYKNNLVSVPESFLPPPTGG